MITIAVSSQKGGVGKTTVSINLAHSFARSGKRTLLVDTDPQGSVGLSLTRQSRVLSGFYDVIADTNFPLEKLIVPTKIDTLSLVPAGQCSDYELGSDVRGAALQQVRRFFELVENQGYDVCIVDTAAGLFGVTADVLSSCDAVIVPQQAEPLGIRSVPKMLEALTKMRAVNHQLNVLGVVMTMVNNRLPESLEAVQALRNILPQSMVLRNVVPRDDLFIRASAKGVPVGAMQEGAGVLAAFDGIRREIENKMGVNKFSH